MKLDYNLRFFSYSFNNIFSYLPAKPTQKNNFSLPSPKPKQTFQKPERIHKNQFQLYNMGCCYTFLETPEFLSPPAEDLNPIPNSSQILKSFDFISETNPAQSPIPHNTSFKSVSPISFIATMDLPESECDKSVDSWKNIQAFKS